MHTLTQVAVDALTTSTAPLVLGNRQAGQSLQLDTSLQQMVNDFHVVGVMPFEATLHLGVLILPPVLHLQYADIQRRVSPAQQHVVAVVHPVRRRPACTVTCHCSCMAFGSDHPSGHRRIPNWTALQLLGSGMLDTQQVYSYRSCCISCALSLLNCGVR